MRLRRQVFLGILIGLAGCVWLTLTRPRGESQAFRPAPPTPLATVAAGPTPTPVKPVVAALTSMRILLYGVSLSVTDPITDLVYGEVKDGTHTWAGFTTESLLARYSGCTAGALGTLVRAPAPPTPSPSPTRTPTPTPSNTPYPTKTPVNQTFRKTVGGYVYTYRPSYSNCATDQAGRDILAEDRAALKNAALPTLAN